MVTPAGADANRSAAAGPPPRARAHPLARSVAITATRFAENVISISFRAPQHGPRMAQPSTRPPAAPGTNSIAEASVFVLSSPERLPSIRTPKPTVSGDGELRVPATRAPLAAGTPALLLREQQVRVVLNGY